jgi:transposase-like protein
MEVRKKKHYEIGFKRQVVAELETGKMSISGASKKYEVSPITLRNWQRKLNEGRLQDGPTKREKELERELEKYKVLLAEAHAEREFVKKVNAYLERSEKLKSAVVSGLNLSQFQKAVD